jgi:hypothetical protein
MKNTLNILFLLIIGAAFGIAVYGSYQAHTKSYQISTVNPEPTIEYVYIEKDPEIITEYVYIPYEEPFYRNLTDEDKDALLDITMREAEGEDVIGQCWVMYTVICRAEAYGQSIKEVCESDAFKSSAFRSGITPNDNCLEALALIEEGWIPKPLWFRRDTYHGFGTPLCQVGKHYFSMR